MQSANQQQPAIQMNDGRSVPITVDQQRDLEMLNLQAQNIALQGELLKRNSEDVQRAINDILGAAIAADKAAQAAAVEAAKPSADVLPFVKPAESAAVACEQPHGVAPDSPAFDEINHSAPAPANEAPADPQSA